MSGNRLPIRTEKTPQNSNKPRNLYENAYIVAMKRRSFLQSLAAVFSLPVTSSLALRPVTAAVPVAVQVPNQARFWAIYISALHGECTPKTLQNLLHIPERQATSYIGQLVADGVIKPTPLMKKAVSEVFSSRDENLLDRFKKRLDMKAKAGSQEADALNAVEERVLPEEEEIELVEVDEPEKVQADTIEPDGEEPEAGEVDLELKAETKAELAE